MTKLVMKIMKRKVAAAFSEHHVHVRAYVIYVYVMYLMYVNMYNTVLRTTTPTPQSFIF
jgi:hypothetical protein